VAALPHSPAINKALGAVPANGRVISSVLLARLREGGRLRHARQSGDVS